jgi:tetratricopeptide (TPR) repeat protein
LATQIELRGPTAFAAYATDDLSRWQLLVYRELEHRDHGRGQVIGVHASNDGLRIRVCFEHLEKAQERSFSLDAFLDGRIVDISLPPTLADVIPAMARSRPELADQQARAEQTLEHEEASLKQALAELERRRRVIERHSQYRLALLKERSAAREADRTRTLQRLLRFALAIGYLRQQAAEESARDHFKALKAQYDLSYRDDSPTSPLYPVLMKLADGSNIDPQERRWLQSKGLDRQMAPTLAEHFERRADLTGNWDLVIASSYWRKAKTPEKALAATERSAPRDPPLEAARLTTRGGALRDLGKLTEALAHGHQALEYPPERQFPHNLLGAVYFELGDPQRGDHHFERALALGASQAQVDSDQREALERAEPMVRERVAQYLVRKDPARYWWARTYLNEPASSPAQL